ncbi:MAG: YciI family protein [Pseudomonadota bacterium]
MLFALICEDKADSEALRKATRDDHLAYVGNFDVQLAGPMLDDDQETMIGSIIILETENLAAAQAFADQDPYALAGLFERVTIRPFRRVIGG